MNVRNRVKKTLRETVRKKDVIIFTNKTLTLHVFQLVKLGVQSPPPTVTIKLPGDGAVIDPPWSF